MDQEGIDPHVIEMVLSQGASGLVHPSAVSGGLDVKLDGFVESGILSPDAAGAMAGCVTAGVDFNHCVYQGTSTLGNQIPGGATSQREFRQHTFFNTEARAWRYIAGGLTLWPVGDFRKTSGSIAVCPVNATFNIAGTFASISNLSGAVVMSVAEAYERGISVPMLVGPTRMVLPINSAGVVANQQVTYAPDEFETSMAPDFTSIQSMYYAETHFVRPAIMYAMEGMDPAVTWLAEWRNNYEYVPLFRRESAVSRVSSMGIEDAHARASAVFTPEWVGERGAPGITMMSGEHDDAEEHIASLNRLARKATKAALGDEPPLVIPRPPRVAGTRTRVKDERSTLSKATGRAKDADTGFVSSALKRARNALKSHYPQAKDHPSGWFDETMAKAGSMFGNILDAVEFGTGLVDDYESDPNAKDTVNAALSAAAML